MSQSNYLSLKSATATKIGKGNGAITYHILTDINHQQLYIAIIHNQDNGHFSLEAVPFVNIQQCLKGLKENTLVSSKQFFPAFESKSNNNAGFLAAILRAETLLGKSLDDVRKHVLLAGWDIWQERMLAKEGKPYALPLKASPIPTKLKPKGASHAKNK